MKIAAAAYPLDWITSWSHYEDKLAAWVSDAAGQGADLVVFPEYAAMELAALAGEAAAGDVAGSIAAVSERMDEANALHARLAAEYSVHVLGGSAPVRQKDRVVNRAHLFTPDGRTGHQDKQIMTRFEREDWNVAGGGPLHLFETELGRIGVLICYDSEFPLLGRALRDADVLLVPSCTEALAGYWRVRIGAMARALENQCVAVMASLVGEQRRLFAVEENTGAGGIFGPPDIGFPPTGVLAAGAHDRPGWTMAEVDIDAIARVRAEGVVRNRSHWPEQKPRCGDATYSDLR